MRLVSISVTGNIWTHTANNPPKAPETVAAEKNTAARIPNSDRLYQLIVQTLSGTVTIDKEHVALTMTDSNSHPGRDRLAMGDK